MNKHLWDLLNSIKWSIAMKSARTWEKLILKDQFLPWQRWNVIEGTQIFHFTVNLFALSILAILWSEMIEITKVVRDKYILTEIRQARLIYLPTEAVWKWYRAVIRGYFMERVRITLSTGCFPVVPFLPLQSKSSSEISEDPWRIYQASEGNMMETFSFNLKNLDLLRNKSHSFPFVGVWKKVS